MTHRSLQSYGIAPIHLGASLLCFTLLGAGWWLGLRPLMSESHEATAVVAAAQAAEREAEAATREFQRLADALADAEAKLEAQPIDLQDAGQINPLLADLAARSERHALEITRTNAGRAIALTHYDYVPIKLAGEGRYADFLALLTGLYEQRADLGVVDFSLARQPTGGIAFEIQMAWYVRSDRLLEEQAPDAQPTAAVPVP
jgi:Tfp pilus assembly protein PilO